MSEMAGTKGIACCKAFSNVIISSVVMGDGRLWPDVDEEAFDVDMVHLSILSALSTLFGRKKEKSCPKTWHLRRACEARTPTFGWHSTGHKAYGTEAGLLPGQGEAGEVGVLEALFDESPKRQSS